MSFGPFVSAQAQRIQCFYGIWAGANGKQWKCAVANATTFLLITCRRPYGKEMLAISRCPRDLNEAMHTFHCTQWNCALNGQLAMPNAKKRIYKSGCRWIILVALRPSTERFLPESNCLCQANDKCERLFNRIKEYYCNLSTNSIVYCKYFFAEQTRNAIWLDYDIRWQSAIEAIICGILLRQQNP